MKYSFIVRKADTVTQEEFEMAFNCSVQAVESLIDDLGYSVKADLPSIVISSNEDSASPITLSECKSHIKGAFVDSDHYLYPEFSIVIPSKIG